MTDDIHRVAYRQDDLIVARCGKHIEPAGSAPTTAWTLEATCPPCVANGPFPPAPKLPKKKPRR